jgi:hypothetical protein
MGTIVGWLFFTGTGALFLWGLWMGYRGIMADHEAWLSFGHAPGAARSFDARHAGHKTPRAA